MLFANKLEQGIFLKRYKRFFADIETKNGVEVAHVANTGSLKGVTDTQKNLPQRCLFSRVSDPNRKLKLSLEAIEVNGHWVGVNTSLPNKLVATAFQDKIFPHWTALGYDRYQPEVKISEESRVDLVLWDSQKVDLKKLSLKDVEKGAHFHLVEVKNVTLAKDGIAMFPDAVTERGQKHLEELIHYVKLGAEAEIFFVIQRDDCKLFSPAKHIDPTYADLLKKAQKEGVIITAAVAKIDDVGVTLTGQTLTVVLD